LTPSVEVRAILLRTTLVQIAPLTDPRNPVRFFDRITDRPAVTLAAVLATVAVGARALIGLESSVDPGLGRPAIGIAVRYSGALPSDIEREVVGPIERRVAGVRGTVRTESTAQEGVGRVVVYFDYLGQIEGASRSIRDSVDAARRELPPGTEAPVISRIHPPVDAKGQPGGALARSGLTIVGAGLLALTILLGVGSSSRSALIVSIAVAVSVTGTLELAAIVGLSLTPATLLAVGLAMMFFLDDAVIVRESIVRQAELGSNARSAASRGALSVVRGLGLAGIASLVVFGPVSMIGGLAGRWLAEVSMVVVAAAAVSLIVAATLIPATSMILVQPSRRTVSLGTWSGRVDSWFETVADRYHELLAWSLRHRRGITAGAVVVAAGFAVSMTRGAIADADPASIELEILGPDTHTLLGVAQRIGDEIRDIDGVSTPAISTTANGDGEELARIDHIDGGRVVRVQTTIDRRLVRDVVTEMEATLSAIPFPPGYDVRHGGQSADRAFTIRRLSWVFGVGLALVAALLAVRFRTLLAPIAILACVPVAWAGGYVALLVTRTRFELLTLIAGAFLTVLVVRHGVQLLTAYRDRRTHDANDRVSLIEAGRARLRPTFISAVAMIGVLATVALASGTPAVHRSLAIALVGGVVASCVATLVVIPAVYAVLEDIALVFATRFRASLALGKRRIGALPGADDEGVMGS
jgi:multidrug efflux pump subunit AcrB